MIIFIVIRNFLTHASVIYDFYIGVLNNVGTIIIKITVKIIKNNVFSR